MKGVHYLGMRQIPGLKVSDEHLEGVFTSVTAWAFLVVRTALSAFTILRYDDTRGYPAISARLGKVSARDRTIYGVDSRRYVDSGYIADT